MAQVFVQVVDELQGLDKGIDGHGDPSVGRRVDGQCEAGQGGGQGGGLGGEEEARCIGVFRPEGLGLGQLQVGPQLVEEAIEQAVGHDQGRE